MLKDIKDMQEVQAKQQLAATAFETKVMQALQEIKVFLFNLKAFQPALQDGIKERDDGGGDGGDGGDGDDGSSSSDDDDDDDLS